MEYWYDWPMQCRYLKDDRYREGIVYQDFIIDLISGAPYKLSWIYAEAKINGVDEDDAVIEWADWKDLSNI